MSQWIALTDRVPPPEMSRKMIWLLLNGTVPAYGYYAYDSDGWCFADHQPVSDRVTHWCEIERAPQAPMPAMDSGPEMCCQYDCANEARWVLYTDVPYQETYLCDEHIAMNLLRERINTVWSYECKRRGGQP